MRGSLGALLLVSLLAPAKTATGKEFTVAPTPVWVKPVMIDWASRPEQNQVSDGVHYVLSEVQVQISKSDKVAYRRSVATALNARGVESLGHVEIGFDPSYQTLTLHAVTVYRAGRSIPKLASSTVRVLQREKDLEYRIFDGTKTANLFLDDLRVGDSVEYSYSISGSNPVFGNRQFGRFDLQWQAPVAHVYRRLNVPAGRTLALSSRNTRLSAQVTDSASGREYIWDVVGQPALVVESEAPGWFDPYASVQWSEFESWGAVARWAEPMYRVPARLGPALQREIDRIASNSADPGERMLAALRFVQSEVRYLGVEVGPGSYAPNPPQLVLDRRFGDCKDKTMLTISLLRGLGIEAQPALVHTTLRRTVADEPPSPAVFNHVIVHAHVGDRDYWLDPTRARQQGDLSTIFQPDYGVALLVAPGTQALVKMPALMPPSFGRTIQVEFDMRPGYDQPVRLTVKSTYKGSGADGVRNMLASQSRDELQQRYLNFYARSYPNIKIAEPLSEVDDASANQMTVVEQYWVTDLWKRNATARRDEFSIHAADMGDLLAQPKESIRKSPLAQQFPMDLTLITSVLLPDDWDIAPSRTHVDDPAFDFEQSIVANRRRFVLTNHFVSRSDQIAAADVPAYAAKLKKADDVLGYRLFHRGSGSAVASGSTGMGAGTALALLVGSAGLALWIWLAWKFYRFDPAPRPTAPRGTFEMPLIGISGWLLLAALAVLASPVRLLVDMSKSFPTFTGGSWATMWVSDAASYDPPLAMLLVFELVTNLAMLVTSLLLVVLFFQKRTSAPRLFIGFLAAATAVQLLDAAAASAMPNFAEAGATLWTEFARTAIGALVWTSYFLRSRRVRETFVQRRRRDAPTPDAVAQPIA